MTQLDSTSKRSPKIDFQGRTVYTIPSNTVFKPTSRQPTLRFLTLPLIWFYQDENSFWKLSFYSRQWRIKKCDHVTPLTIILSQLVSQLVSHINGVKKLIHMFLKTSMAFRLAKLIEMILFVFPSMDIVQILIISSVRLYDS